MNAHPAPPEAPSGAEGPARRVVSLRWRLLPVALLALGLGVATVAWLGRAPVPPNVARAERLAAAARELARLAPTLWRGIELLGPAELEAPHPLPEAGLRAITPKGLVVDGRPRTRWGGVPLESTVEVRLSSRAGGTSHWRLTGQGGVLEFPNEEPALPPGAYEVAIRSVPDGPLARSRFEVVDEPTRARLRATLDVAREQAPADLRTLLAAHACARLGFLVEAESRAQAALGEDPRNADALALLRWVHTQLGESEGWKRAR